MVTYESFVRNAAIHAERRTLAAPTYNLFRILQRRHHPEPLFVPIRPMLYLAVIDEAEILFIDGAVSHREIQLVWQDFRACDRAGLDDPVAFRVLYYMPSSLNLLPRLQGEFHRALLRLQQKGRTDFPGAVRPLH